MSPNYRVTKNRGQTGNSRDSPPPRPHFTTDTPFSYVSPFPRLPYAASTTSSHPQFSLEPRIKNLGPPSYGSSMSIPPAASRTEIEVNTLAPLIPPLARSQTTFNPPASSAPTPPKPLAVASTPEINSISQKAKSDLLASKSNYQLITTNTSTEVGLSFPPNILAGNTARRFSRSSAERARRGVLNAALQDLDAVMLQECCDQASREAYAASVNGKDDGKVQQVKTKVCTVELAIEYIKCMQMGFARSRMAGDGGVPQGPQYMQ